MDEAAARDALLSALAGVGVRRGDVLYLGVDMSGFVLPRLPVPRSRAEAVAQRDRHCAFLLEVLREAVGDGGTLLAPTFSYAYARTGTPYVHGTSPSELSPFTEHLRTRPGALRSFHPLYS